MLRHRHLLWMPLLLLSFGCGSDTSGPSREVFQVAATQTAYETFPDGSFAATYTLRVTDQSGTRVTGAVVVIDASHGTVTPTQGTSGTGGLLTVDWTVTPADRGSATSLELRACAENTAPPTCTPATVTTISVSQ